jgi:Leucine-rich repeat (LRR) protein
MKRVAPLILVLAAVALVGGNGDVVAAAEPPLYKGRIPMPFDGPRNVVPEERAALEKLWKAFHAGCDKNSAGHVVYVSICSTLMQSSGPIDVNFISDLKYIEELDVRGVRIAPHGLDVLPKLTRLTDFTLAGTEGEGVDEPVLLLPKIRNLRRLALRTNRIGEEAKAQIAKLHGLEELLLVGQAVDDGFLAGVSGLKGLKNLDISDAPVSDDGLAAIEGLTNLESLVLPPQIGEAGYQYLRKLVKLRHLKPVDKMTDGKLAALSDMTELEELDLAASPISDAGLAHLAQMGKLRSLKINSSEITDAGMAQLKGLTGLQELIVVAGKGMTGARMEFLDGMSALETLSLESAGISDAGFVHLQGLKRLRLLTIRPGKYTVGGLKYVGSLPHLEELRIGQSELTDDQVALLRPPPKLRYLDASWTAIGDRGAETISRIGSLTGLSLRRTKIGNDGLAKLARLKELIDLDVGETNVSDAGVAQISQFPRLTSVSLFRDNITDAAVPDLRRWKKLKGIDLVETDMTGQGVDVLRAAFPKAIINWSAKRDRSQDIQ